MTSLHARLRSRFGRRVFGIACTMMGIMIGISGPLRADVPEHVDFQVVNQVSAQQNGDYGALERPESVPLGQIQEAWNAAEPNAGVYSVNFEPQHIIRLKSRIFTTTSIILPKWEEIEDISLGDNDSFLVEKKTKNIVSIMPKGEGCDTTLTIIGKSGNVYAFYIRAEGVHSKSLPDIVVYVQGEFSTFSKKKADLEHTKTGPESGVMRGFTNHTPADYINSIPFAPENITFSFKMSAKNPESIEIAPQKVYSDGIWIWLDYENTWDRITLPAVYRIIDGVDTPVNTRIKDSKIIVHGTAPLTLKSGQKVVCIMPSEQ
ncbi:MAG: hypothetical protein B7Y25_07385 [Alphaproteobacteria bacterium 16-39-46]|nr:MAG: hypothetical protein B7Y25_07385 [Alphaproteobacteria bacterium 16-39-46]OZA41696.1 MAG: hypothetical protein B7X84_07575 [Alphaproteobacteria bacterium 17-39-52]HQS84737.1 TrbG/VirB9 family P-type conjugative transfer protein [Alphaproteobacteria bacterium]HQS94549.1 TrbG/VirB9 family P-type conjugative transfer protein [Alphaproteobacteria bacterium]